MVGSVVDEHELFIRNLQPFDEIVPNMLNMNMTECKLQFILRRYTRASRILSWLFAAYFMSSLLAMFQRNTHKLNHLCSLLRRKKSILRNKSK